MTEVPEVPTELSYDRRMINSKIVASTKTTSNQSPLTSTAAL